MSFLAKTWSGFLSTLKLMMLPFKGDKVLGKQLHVTIKQINDEPSILAHCQGCTASSAILHANTLSGELWQKMDITEICGTPSLMSETGS